MRLRNVWWVAIFLAWMISGPVHGATNVLYETRFERSEGFDPDLTLIGQGGWVGDGSGGNGLVIDFFPGEGQHAFVGYGAPTNSGEFLSVWRPVNYTPGPTNPPLLRFSVLMSIEDSTTTTNRDDFRWSVYNLNDPATRLFTLDFDNYSLGINYLLDDNEFVATGHFFTNATPYRLEIEMDFARNRWSAWLNGNGITTNLAITTRNAALNFGDIDAVWAIRTPGKPGDNFLVFDNLRITAEAVPPNPPPRLEPLGLLRPGEFLVRCHGVSGVTYVVEGSADLRQWSPLKTNAVPADGYFDHLDRGGSSRRFYRLLER